MATQKSTQPGINPVLENLLQEIANTADSAELRIIASSPGGNADATELELDFLRQVVKQMGWMADFALKRMGSLSTVHDGDAAAWLLWPVTVKLLIEGAQS